MTTPTVIAAPFEAQNQTVSTSYRGCQICVLAEYYITGLYFLAIDTFRWTVESASTLLSMIFCCFVSEEPPLPDNLIFADHSQRTLIRRFGINPGRNICCYCATIACEAFLQGRLSTQEDLERVLAHGLGISLNDYGFRVGDAFYSLDAPDALDAIHDAFERQQSFDPRGLEHHIQRLSYSRAWDEMQPHFQGRLQAPLTTLYDNFDRAQGLYEIDPIPGTEQVVYTRSLQAWVNFDDAERGAAIFTMLNRSIMIGYHPEGFVLCDSHAPRGHLITFNTIEDLVNHLSRRYPFATLARFKQRTRRPQSFAIEPLVLDQEGANSI